MNYKISAIFCKTKDMRLISHLDLMRLFQRALRRADLPIRITNGFNPHPKISVNRALKLGIESENEEAMFYMAAGLPAEEFKERLNKQLPEGIQIKNAKTDTD
ncbi:MAG: TIGR03936 family radical SAM-associated protein [Candidatus Omnitrophica bacterium]|nr:TIGR03936 family radical SAM-associated protein [Candidatus Omnitrophota bacterium]